MIRFLKRKLLLCIFLVALFLSLKRYLPEIGSTVGKWISGAADERVTAAFSKMLDAFSEGSKEAVEVFADGLRSAESN